MVATVWGSPSNQTAGSPCAPTLAGDLGCNAFWLRDEAWALYTRTQAASWILVRYSLGDTARMAVILYFPLFLADDVHGGVALARLDIVVADIVAAGMEVLLLVGRPDYYGHGTLAEQWNPVKNTAAQNYVMARLDALVRRPALAAPALSFVSLYWMGAACAAQGGCTEALVAAFTRRTRDTVFNATAGAVPYLQVRGFFSLFFSFNQFVVSFFGWQHLDGPFWEACWPQPCATFVYGGYSPTSLNGSADGLLTESWVQGSLSGGVKRLYADGVVTNATLLLIDDIPNCDMFPTQRPCATGNCVCVLCEDLCS
jgi:hypothetical protein